MNTFCLLLAVLSIWDYPARFPEHHRLSQQFVAAVRSGDTATMEAVCQKGVVLLPDDPTWHYNLACSLAYFPNRAEKALDELEKAIDLGFRDRQAIEQDTDLKRLSKDRRYQELLEYAEFMKSRPLITGPMASVDATGVFGSSIALGEQNLSWDFEVGCFLARMQMAPGRPGANVGDLYMNRDGLHSALGRKEFPGLTWVSFDSDGTNRNMHLDYPNILCPYPLFGNCSRAYTEKTYWRSLPRMLMTAETIQLNKMLKFYLSNQFWVFPSNQDTPPVGTNGDVFASLTPYWVTTAGRSWSDLPYLRAALDVSRTLRRPVKTEIVKRGLLTPVIQTLIRKSFKSVTNEVDYLTEKAHPTAFPANGFDRKRLLDSAATLETDAIPPLAIIAVEAVDDARPERFPELTYATGFAWAYVLRADAKERAFRIRAKGAEEFAFAQTHGAGVKVKIAREAADCAKVTINRIGMSPTNRVDIAVFGRNKGTGWGAPSYVSFARMDSAAPYSDPILTLQAQPIAK